MKSGFLAVVFALVFFINNSSHAQELKFGVRGGLIFNFPSVSPSTENLAANTPGFLIGMHLDYRINKRFTTRLATDFTNKGTNYNSILYLDFPLDLVYYIPLKKNKIMFGAGPVMSVRMSHYDQEEFDRFTYGINVIAGYEFPLGFSMNLNYTHDALNTINSSFYYTEYRNRTLAFTVGYLF